VEVQEVLPAHLEALAVLGIMVVEELAAVVPLVLEEVGGAALKRVRPPPVVPPALVALVPLAAPIHQQTVALSAAVTEPSMFPLLTPPLPTLQSCTTPTMCLLLPGNWLLGG